MGALIRYYSHFMLDPDKMTEEEFAKTWGNLQYALEQTGQMKKQ